MWRAVVLLASAAAGHARVADSSPHPFHRLPQLYHLDHYDRCLASPGGLYCSGSFKITAEETSPVYDLLEAVSADRFLFNRSNLYRGYCISERCPSTEKNSTWRFEQCVQRDVSKAGLRAKLDSYHCYTNSPERPPDAVDRMFLGAVFALLFFNILGTLYDYITGGQGKSKLLMAWSMRANWARLTASYEDGDKRLLALAPIQGVRCSMIVIVIVTHTITINHYVYCSDPTVFEKLVIHPMMVIMKNGTSMIQLFFVISNFLYGYISLIYAKEHKSSFADIPLRILYRVVRLSPVHLGVVGYAATWWRRAGDGPQWDSMVGAESAICRRKFWLHAFYLHNLVDSKHHCLMQNWYLAVDFQLYIVATVVLLILEKKKWRPVPALARLFVGSVLMNMVLAYLYDWKAILYIFTPENLRTLFENSESFNNYYITPWGSLPACFMGLLLAHVHYRVQETQYPLTKLKVFMWVYRWSVELLICWICMGSFVEHSTSPVVRALYLAVERPVFAVLVSIFFIGAFNNIDSAWWRLAAWRGWQLLGRLTMSIFSIHWCVTLIGVAGRRSLTDLGFFSLTGDTLSTLWWSCWLAIPTTVMLEYPFLKTFTALLRL